jgi:nicotinamide-nucleotide amidase
MGTAPGWCVRHGEQLIIAMPGVPREMYRMWQDQAVPRILERLASNAIVSRTLKTIGIGESALEQEILDIVERGRPTVATYAKDDGVHVRITATDESAQAAEREVRLAEQEIRARIGQHVYGYLEDSLASVILELIAAAGEQLAIWEAGNAGRLTSLLQEAPQADTTIVAVRSTSFDIAADALGYPASALDLAGACATAAAQRSGADIGVSVAIQLTPSGHPDRMRGSIGMALWRHGELATREQQVSAVTPEIRRRATMSAADFLWSMLRDPAGVQPD